MDKPYIIGITGGSGSGKSSILRHLEEHFSRDEVCVLSMDNYYFPRESQHMDEQGVTNFDLPAAVDIDGFFQDLKKLMRGEDVKRTEYTFNNNAKKAGQLQFKSAPVIAIEGLYVFYDERIRNMCDLKVFVHARSALKVIRRIKRDERERNYPLEDVLYRYENHVLPSFDRDISQFMEDSDIVINNNTSYSKGLAVLEGYIHSLL